MSFVIVRALLTARHRHSCCLFTPRRLNQCVKTINDEERKT